MQNSHRVAVLSSPETNTTMLCLKLCRRRFSVAMLLTSLAVFPWTDCRFWELQTVIQNITVENGVESDIDFFLSDYRSLNVSLRLIVQHRSSNGSFNKKCQLEHLPSRVCKVTSGPCECMGESSGSYRYRLRMTFREQDGGQWMFRVFNHGKTLVNITVIPPRALKIFTNSQSLTVEDGETSSIDFFLNDSTAVDTGVKIVVQHKTPGGVTFDSKCRIDHSKTGGCQILFGPCECIGERSITFEYRLRMMFTNKDDGLWQFNIVNHEGTIVNVTVNQSLASLQGQESTESLQVTSLTPTIESYTLSTTIVVISIIIVIIIFIIILLVAVRCHSRNQRTPIGKTESRSEEQHQDEDPDLMEQGQFEVQSSMTATSRHVQSAHHLEQITETKELFSGSLKGDQTTDFRKSIETDSDSVISTATATAPSTPELPPRLYT